MERTYDMSGYAGSGLIALALPETEAEDRVDLGGLRRKIAECRSGRKRESCLDCHEFPCQAMMAFPHCPETDDGGMLARALEQLPLQ